MLTVKDLMERLSVLDGDAVPKLRIVDDPSAAPVPIVSVGMEPGADGNPTILLFGSSENDES